ncbi:MAG TPA: hypothetical protein VJN96_13260 [Vicinamibacterales bacterium]|nr:hypothetical protein [Vicinamibacterales bacterium]
MRKPLLVGLGLLMMIGTVVAQTHDNMNEKKVSDVVYFSTDVRVGAVVLKAGEYRVACDTKKVTFTLQVLAKDREWVNTLDPVERLAVQKSDKALEVPCLGKDLGAKADHTLMQLGEPKDGVRSLDKLYLRGSSIEHVF